MDGTVNQVKQDFKENLYRVGGTDIPVNASAPFDMINSSQGRQVLRIHEGKQPNDVLQYLLQQGVQLNSFNEILPSLNDIFIKLVEGTPNTRQFQNL